MTQKISAKQRMLNALKQKSGYNTFTVKQAQRRFGVKNVSARIDELRQEGHCIYTNTKKLENGDTVKYYKSEKHQKRRLKNYKSFIN